MGFTTEQIRNIAVAGHGATGKTTFVERVLFEGGAIPKPETVESGKTVSDNTPEEIDQTISIHLSLSTIEWKDAKINILDTPGGSDFVGEVVAAFRVGESAVMLVDARSGVQIETIKLWRRLEQRNKPRMVFLNKMDVERSSFKTALDDLNDKFSANFVPLTIPMGDGTDFQGVIDLLEKKAYPIPGVNEKEKAVDIPDEFKDMVEEYSASLMELAAEGDDELVEKFLEEETLTPEEIMTGLTKGVREATIVPVFCGSSLTGAGIKPILNFISNAGPSPAGRVEHGSNQEGEEIDIPVSSSEQFSGFVFKTSIDQFSGKLSYIKVVSGVLSGDQELYHAAENKKEKAGKVYTALGKKLNETDELPAGDIGILSKIAAASTNDTLCSPDRVVSLEPLKLPQPVYAVAISAASKKDEDKLSQQLHRVSEEDMTFQVRFNPETKETVVSGMGEQHINMVLDKIKESQKIEIETRIPKVAYRETITKPASATYRHKKQTGGHGQFGEVSINVNPIPRGEYYSFENQIRGMAISKGYIPGIEKGLHEAMEEGIVAGYPVVDVAIALVDGKEHPVDSSEMAFKLASRGALNDAMAKASPVLLEPVMNLSVFVDEQYLGDVLSDLSSKRGKVMGQEPIGGGIMEIKAQVPQSEMLRYAIDLKSITSGTGSFELEFSHYNPISGKVADDVVKAAKAESEE
ncbi:MAG: elongation factor G [Spirochaetia bacterium]